MPPELQARDRSRPQNDFALQIRASSGRFSSATPTTRLYVSTTRFYVCAKLQQQGQGPFNALQAIVEVLLRSLFEMQITEFCSSSHTCVAAGVYGLNCIDEFGRLSCAGSCVLNASASASALVSASASACHCPKFMECDRIKCLAKIAAAILLH